MEKVVFIGAGSMAEAMISGILKNEYLLSKQIYVTNQQNDDRLNELQKRYKINSERNKEKLMKNADMILLTVKPSDLKVVISSFKEYFQASQLVISVLAGISTNEIEDLLDHQMPVIRAMPNTSASIGYSATALSAGKYVLEEHLTMTENLLQTIGETVIVSDEDMDTVTGISGSGPAYIYYLVEAMEKVAISHGLNEKTAKSLIAQTIIGAGKMLKTTDHSTKSLREKVTSPKGTTEAALQTFAEKNFQAIVEKGVRSAIKRSKELREE